MENLETNHLKNLRWELDKLDQEILALFQRRMQLCEKVVQFKKKNGKPVLDTQREKEKLLEINKQTAIPYQKGARELFFNLMSIGRKKQYELLGEDFLFAFEEKESLQKKNITVAFQGVEGAYSHLALQKYFGQSSDILPKAKKEFMDVMKAVETGEADYAVLPIENSTVGIIFDVYDLLALYDHAIVGEIGFPIKHALLAVPGTTLESIRIVYSHPQALAQSAEFLKQYPQWSIQSMENTAAAAKKIALDNDQTQAAIASETAADLYHLNRLKEEINFEKNNETRFIVISKRKFFLSSANKVSIYFEIPHESGSLYSVLSHFFHYQINMSKIESRPILRKKWEYRFFIDFIGNLKESSVQHLLQGIKAETFKLKILGNY
ncbi:chorismate mutase [Clostridia bacterium]|nr:chorismate mutase [Clostridia bacterium]